MNVLDLFSGIGGFSLGLERAGMRTVAFCEIDPYCRAVLRKHWPSVPIIPDVRDVPIGYGAFPHNPRIHVICGGPPCQRTSVAAAISGKRTGESLWPEMLRLIDCFRPDWAIIEQPPGNAKWEAEVAESLAGIGYQSSRLQRSSASCGAVHLRRRVFIVANAVRERCDEVARVAGAPKADELARTTPPRGTWRAPGPGNSRMDDGLSGWVDRLKSLGNTVDPRVTEIIGRAIMQAEGIAA